jgi:hypothetical protein
MTVMSQEQQGVRRVEPGASNLPGHRLPRVLAVLALASLIAVHVPVAVVHISEVPYLGVAFYLFILASAALLGSLVERSRTGAWVFALVGAALALVTYLVSRTIGLPGASDDVGDWSNTLGLISVASELLLIVVAAYVLISIRRHHQTH